MEPALVVGMDELTQGLAGLARRGPIMQVDVVILDRAPQAPELHVDVYDGILLPMAEARPH